MEKIDKAGWKAVFKVYPKKNFHKSIRWPVAITIVLCIVMAILDCDYYEINKILCNNILSSLPSILGFSIAAYALILGFSANKLLLAMFKKKAEEDSSFFQVLSSTYAIMNLSLLVTLFSAFAGNILVVFL